LTKREHPAELISMLIHPDQNIRLAVEMCDQFARGTTSEDVQECWSGVHVLEAAGGGSGLTIVCSPCAVMQSAASLRLARNDVKVKGLLFVFAHLVAFN
jgi:hypothetical protein